MDFPLSFGLAVFAFVMFIGAQAFFMHRKNGRIAWSELAYWGACFIVGYMVLRYFWPL